MSHLISSFLSTGLAKAGAHMLALLLASSALLPQLRLSPPLCPTPHCVRAAGVSMAAEELLEQFTDWVEDFLPQLLKSEPEPAIVPLRVLAGILMVHHVRVRGSNGVAVLHPSRQTL